MVGQYCKLMHHLCSTTEPVSLQSALQAILRGQLEGDCNRFLGVTVR